MKPAALSLPAMEALVSEQHIPYLAPVDPFTLKTMDGGFLQILRLGGFAFETADHSDINLRKRIRNQLWKSFDNSHFAVYYHVIRRRQPVLPDGDFPPGFSRDLNEEWKRQLARKTMYANELYMTVLHKHGEGVARKLGDAFGSLSYSRDAEARRDYESRAVRDLNDAVRTITESLKPYRPELLKIVEMPDEHILSEQMRFLGFLLNLAERDYVLPQRPIAELLATSRPVFRHEVIEFRQAARTLYAAMLSIKEYDRRTAPHMMDKLLGLPVEFVMTQSFRFEERAFSVEQIERQRRRLVASWDKARSQIGEIDEAMDEATGGEAAFGLHHMSMLLWHENPDVLLGQVAAVDAAFAEQGITCVREDVNLEAAFYAQLPGNYRYITRAARISTKNFACFASGHNYALGRQRAHWGGAISMLRTASGTPYYLNLHVADRGNTLVLGPTGRGKTLTLSFIFAQSLKLGGRRVFLDKDRGMEIFVRAVGGKYFRIEEGRPTGWNPLKWPDSPASRAFLCTWLESLLVEPGEGTIDAAERQVVVKAINSVYDLPRDHRLLRHIAPVFGNPEQNRLARRLLDWYASPEHGTGRFAWLFDNDVSELDLSNDVIGFDLTQIVDNARACVPTLLWLFFAIESLIDGRPIAILVDEGWKVLQDDAAVRWIENFEFTIRKNNGLIVFATQAPESIMASRGAESIKQQSETMILFPNPKADEEVYCRYLGLSAKQFDLIKRKLPERNEPGWFLVMNSDGAAVCRLDMTDMEEYVAVLSGNKNTLTLLDTLIAEHGEDPAVWLPLFRAQV